MAKNNLMPDKTDAEINENTDNNKNNNAKKTKEKKSRKKDLVQAVILLIAIFCGGYIYLFVGPKQKNMSNEIQSGAEGTNALIVYFSRSGNIRADELDNVDALTAASMNANDGATEFAAVKLQEITGADIFEIRTSRNYRKSYGGTAAAALIEEKLGTRPSVASYPESLDKYDIIYIGYPIWWFNAPMVIGTFLEHYDLSGKTVIPFCTAQDNGIGVSMDYINEVSGNATVLEGTRIYNSATNEDIMNWLKEIGTMKDAGIN